MLAFIIVVGAIAAFLQKQIVVAFMSNPGLNALIVLVEAIGIALALRQVLRLYPEIAWVNNIRRGGDPTRVRRPPVLSAPMAAILGSRKRAHVNVRAIDARPFGFHRHTLG